MKAAKILSVDDSKMIHMVIGKAFKNFDVDLLYASNGVEGLAVAAREIPSLILLDVTMPVMDGVEALAKLKADPQLKEIPVVMLTAEAGRENVVKIARMGVRDYIIKPFTEDMVVQRVGRVIDLQPKGGVERSKTLEDPANILVVDDKPAIVDQIKQAVQGVPWTVISTGLRGEAIDLCSKTTPDVALVSLSLPDRAGFSLFEMLRAAPRTKSVPIFGLSVKTASEEQSQAQSLGFNGIVTKPIDPEDLMLRMTRAMKIDTSGKYFFIENNVQCVKVPGNTSTAVCADIQTNIEPKTRDMVDSGLDRLLLDMSEVQSADMNMIRLMLKIAQSAQSLSIKLRVLCAPEVAEQAKTFEETKQLEIFKERSAALAGF